MLLPSFNRALDFLSRFARAHFPYEYTASRQKRNQFLEIDVPSERRLVVLRGPKTILHVTPESARTDCLQPFGRIEEGGGLFDLNRAEIVPANDLRRVPCGTPGH